MKKILLIEDEKILVEMYCDKFAKAGFKVFFAFEVKEGLRLAKSKKPDLILLDILIPGENGISFLEKIKKTPSISLIPVVVLSNYDEPKVIKEAFELGIKDYLMKTDYTPKELVGKIKTYLKR